ncbi:hypothetical protein JCM3775_005782 [Rhodotorula graminis]
MSDSITDLLQDTLDRANALSQAAWDSLVPPSLDNLHDLPSHLHATWTDLVDKLTLRQGVPDPRNWLPDAVLPHAPAPPPPPPPPPAPASWPRALASHAAAHPWAYTLAALGLSTGTAYALYPLETTAFLSPSLVRLVPRALLPDPKHRPLRLVPTEHGVAHEVRKECVVVLGAETPHGRDLALDLERRGFVVVATVADPREVDVLEKLSRGWLKALVLDPNESSSVAPFLRSLSTALSLRFPLHTSGDPFARPAHALALTGVVNCLSLAAADAHLPVPLEAAENDDARRMVGERVAVVVGVVKGLVPLLRSAAARPGAPTGVLVSLVPSASSHLALPFHAFSSAADAAISSLLHSLRRELTASTTSNVHLSIIEVGFFESSSSPSSSNNAAASTTGSTAVQLPIRLDAIYAPALARRQPGSTSTSNSASQPSKGQRKSTELRRLSKRVWTILVRPTHAGAVERVGAGSRTYALVSLVPHALVDTCLFVQDRLFAFYLTHVQRALALRRRIASRGGDRTGSGAAHGAGGQGGAAGGAARPPLPSVPPSLRPANKDAPAPSHVGAGHGHHHHTQAPSSQAASTRASSSAGGDDDAQSESSLEDFGPLGGGGGAGAGAGAEAPSMDGSFVHV